MELATLAHQPRPEALQIPACGESGGVQRQFYSRVVIVSQEALRHAAISLLADDNTHAVLAAAPTVPNKVILWLRIFFFFSVQACAVEFLERILWLNGQAQPFDGQRHACPLQTFGQRRLLASCQLGIGALAFRRRSPPPNIRPAADRIP